MDLTISNPITSIIDIGKTVLNKFVADKMSEADRLKLEQEFELAALKEATNAEGAFRDFVLKYEGEAKDMPYLIQVIRAAIRPAFTIAVGWWDYLFFIEALPWPPEKVALLKAINLIVLIFWFGERAVQNTGLAGILMAQKK
jgi:hypothetical protein